MPKPPTRYKKNGSPMKKRAKRVTKRGEYRDSSGILKRKKR